MHTTKFIEWRSTQKGCLPLEVDSHISVDLFIFEATSARTTFEFVRSWPGRGLGRFPRRRRPSYSSALGHWTWWLFCERPSLKGSSFYTRDALCIECERIMHVEDEIGVFCESAKVICRWNYFQNRVGCILFLYNATSFIKQTTDTERTLWKAFGERHTRRIKHFLNRSL